MNEFVEECRREWRRLGVSETIADEMAEELAADLAEAQADGVLLADFLGEDDPRRFAAAWASERGLVSERAPVRRTRRFWLSLATVLVALLAAGLVVTVVLPTQAGTIPTGLPVSAGECPMAGIQHVLQSCASKSSPWVVSFRFIRADAACRLSFSRRNSKNPVGTPVWTIPGACRPLTWLRPHLLIYSREFPLVNSADPVTRKTTLFAQLSDFKVSPDGKWVAGPGPGDPEVDVEANTVYVVSIHSRKCLVVPGRSTDIAGFTTDSQNVIVDQPYTHGARPLRQFAISSLGSSCPKGILLH